MSLSFPDCAMCMPHVAWRHLRLATSCYCLQRLVRSALARCTLSSSANGQACKLPATSRFCFCFCFCSLSLCVIAASECFLLLCVFTHTHTACFCTRRNRFNLLCQHLCKNRPFKGTETETCLTRIPQRNAQRKTGWNNNNNWSSEKTETKKTCKSAKSSQSGSGAREVKR